MPCLCQEASSPVGWDSLGQEGLSPAHLSMNFWKMPPRRFWQISSM